MITCLLFYLTSIIPLQAQKPDSCLNNIVKKKNRITYGISAGGGKLIPGDISGKELIKSKKLTFYDINFQYRALPTDTNIYDKVFGFPGIEGGILLGDYSNIKLSENPDGPFSSIGIIAGAYGSFNRDIFNNGKWRLGYSLKNGIGICSKPYSPNDNYENLIIGSRWSLFFGTDVYTGIMVSPEWEITLSMGFKHFSNSALDRPNKGANSIDLMAGIRFYPYNGKENNATIKNYRLYYHEKNFKRKFFVDLNVGWNLKTIMQEWMVNYYKLDSDDPRFRSSHYKIYSALALSASGMYRYSRKFASGIGIDYSYTPYINAIKKADTERGATGYKYNKHSIGISLKHNVYYKNLAMNLSIGYYLKRDMGALGVLLDKPYYETVGLKYYIPFLKHIYLGYNVKAHLLSADSMQFNLGLEI